MHAFPLYSSMSLRAVTGNETSWSVRTKRKRKRVNERQTRDKWNTGVRTDVVDGKEGTIRCFEDGDLLFVDLERKSLVGRNLVESAGVDIALGIHLHGRR